MRLAATIDVAVPREVVWARISDPTGYTDLMAGITRWDVESEHAQGLGARYRTLMRVRSAEVGGTIEVVEFDPPADLAWHAVTGIEQRGRWRLRERDPGRTHVELRLGYHLAGPEPARWVTERLAAATIRRNLRSTLQRLKRALELDRPPDARRTVADPHLRDSSPRS